MYVYFIKSRSNPPMLKIGRSDDPIHRMAELQVGCPFGLEMIGTLTCKSLAHSIEIEKLAHHVFRSSKARGEWFRLTDRVQSYVDGLLRGDADAVRHATKELRRHEWLPPQRGLR